MTELSHMLQGREFWGDDVLETFPSQAKNDEYRQALKEQVLDANPSFYYTEVDATHQEYAGFVNNVMKVNTEELKHSPSVAIIEYGQGVWIHGPETVARIANYAPAFAQKAAE